MELGPCAFLEVGKRRVQRIRGGGSEGVGVIILIVFMGYAVIVGKYRLGRTIGEGMFAKVKLAVNEETGEKVAIKIIDKKMVVDSNLSCQVEREISIMKLLHHPNIVRIYEVVATKTKIFLVMEYVSGGQLSDKMAYTEKLSEEESRRYFQQLIDAVDYCHGRGIYHRDLKPENLLIDNKGNLKVSDFGLSIFRKPGDLLSTSCGSPSYVAPEVITHKIYEGAAADVWSCGVILFECLAGYLPFKDRSITNLYRKISRAEYKFPEWFTDGQRKLIGGILKPMAIKRMTVAEILEDEWFRIGYRPSLVIQNEGHENIYDLKSASDSIGCDTNEDTKSKSSSLINAFQLIAMSNDLDLSALFEEESNVSQKTKLGSQHSISETLEKIGAAAKDVSLSVEWMSKSAVRLHGVKKLTRCRSHIMLSAEVTEVTPSHCVVELSKSAGELGTYNEFCRSLYGVLNGNTGSLSDWEDSKPGRSHHGAVKDRSRKGFCEEIGHKDRGNLRGYSSS